MTKRFLHFSDIHFGQERGDGGWEAFPDVRAEALADIERMLASGVVRGPADAILLTGDIAQAGLESEFKIASAWIDEALELGGCPARALRSVPGNHDVNLARMSEAGLQTHNMLRKASVDDAYAYLSALSGQPYNPIADKFVDYRGFAHAYGSDFTSDSNPMSVGHYEMTDGPGLRLIGFSTVIISDRKDEKGKLLLGANQYQVSRERGFEDVVMMHHPLDWLRDSDRAENYLNSRARIVLTGHEHHPTLTKVEHDNSYEQVRLAAGALTPPNAGPGYSYSYNWIEFDWIDPEGGRPRLQVTVYPRAWKPSETRFGPDRDRLVAGESRQLVLSCDHDPPSVRRAAAAPAEAEAKFCAAFVTPGEAVLSEDAPELRMPETDAVPNQVADAENFAKLRFLFWRYLSREQRVDSLIALGLLTERARHRLPSFMEQEAFADAGDDTSLLSALWDRTIPHVPEDQRSPNPFKATS
jgi:3',5'-cyclic AMP phosphodiesterase CpdA